MGYDPIQLCYQGLLGGDTWAIEVTAAELVDFFDLADKMKVLMGDLAEELVDQEEFSCDLQTEQLKLSASGLPKCHHWQVQTVLGRRAEGIWDYGAVLDLCAALPEMRSQILNVTP
ncbi:MAG: DUF1818 family protein [Oscillatoriales cyanobacterium SM2_2_1]|nr:DUF1818 family protein [Oscillatoriales cyanobacterium SM2_2_1]